MIPSWYATVIHLGPIPIQVWGLFVALGFIVATWLAGRWATRAGINPKDVFDFSAVVFIAALVGARFAHVLFYEPGYYLAHPGEIVRVWEGGLSSFGGFLGAWVAALVFTRRRRVSLIRFSDLLLPPFLVGWFIGRLGCYSIHDHPGIPCGGVLCVPFPDGTRRLDMGLLDGLLALTLFVLFLTFRSRFARRGSATAFIMIGYGVGRFALDFLRIADATYFGLTPAQYGSIALLLGGISICLTQRSSKRA